MSISHICSRLSLAISSRQQRADAVNYRNLRTVKQIADANPAFTEASLRWMIYRSEETGLDEVLVRVGRRVLFGMDKFNEWLEQRRQCRLNSRAGSAHSSWQPPRSYAGR